MNTLVEQMIENDSTKEELNVRKVASMDSIPSAQPDPVSAAEAELLTKYKEQFGAGGNPSASGDPEDEIDTLLARAVSDGRVDARGALGARFDRWLNKHDHKKEEYRLSRGQAVKAVHRNMGDPSDECEREAGQGN